MVVDAGVVRNYIKPKADSTLYNMRKVDLIKYIRTLEHNYNVAVSFNENQAKYIESLGFKGVVRCKDCKHWVKCESSLLGEVMCCTGQGSMYIQKKEDDFCSCGERKNNG